MNVDVAIRADLLPIEAPAGGVTQAAREPLDIITQKPCVDLSVESFSDRCFRQCQAGAANAATHVATLKPVRSRPPSQQEPQTLQT